MSARNNSATSHTSSTPATAASSSGTPHAGVSPETGDRLERIGLDTWASWALGESPTQVTHDPSSGTYGVQILDSGVTIWSGSGYSTPRAAARAALQYALRGTAPRGRASRAGARRQ